MLKSDLRDTASKFKNGMKKSILFRCDGTIKVGLGHVSRCLALAEALAEDGFICNFLGQFEDGADELLAAANMAVLESAWEIGSEEDLAYARELIHSRHVSGLVLDSYEVNDTYLTALNLETPVLLIDDFIRLKHYNCSAILNFTVAAPGLKYPDENELCLLGPHFFLARRWLRQIRQNPKVVHEGVRNVLVTMGGVDFHDLSCKILWVLLKIDQNMCVHVIVGRSFRNIEELSSLVCGFVNNSYVAVQLPDLANEFNWADVCICGGGLTKYEAAYAGIPTAVLSQNRDQAYETNQFAGRGLCVDLGLGDEATDTALETRLSVFFSDWKLRKSLSQAGLDSFPENPTMNAAKAFAAIL